MALCNFLGERESVAGFPLAVEREMCFGRRDYDESETFMISRTTCLLIFSVLLRIIISHMNDYFFKCLWQQFKTGFCFVSYKNSIFDIEMVS